MQETKQAIKLPTVEELFNELAPGRDTVFFGVHGLSTTEASHKADLIKTLAESVSAEFTKTNAYAATLDLAGTYIRRDSFETINLEKLSTREGELYALSAWYREAVKAKERLLLLFTNAHTVSLVEDYLPVFTEDAPVMDHQSAPGKLSEYDIIDNWTVAQRAEYLILEAKAAHLGKKIHPNGVISKILKQLENGKVSDLEMLPHPSGAGDATFVVSYNPLYTKADIDALYYKLQEQHRKFESKLNKYKSDIKAAITEGNAQLQQDYANDKRAALEGYQTAYNGYSQRHAAYHAEVSAKSAELEKLKLETVRYVSSLKVITPKDLQHILEELTVQPQ